MVYAAMRYSFSLLGLNNLAPTTQKTKYGTAMINPTIIKLNINIPFNQKIKNNKISIKIRKSVLFARITETGSEDAI